MAYALAKVEIEMYAYRVAEESGVDAGVPSVSRHRALQTTKRVHMAVMIDKMKKAHNLRTFRQPLTSVLPGSQCASLTIILTCTVAGNPHTNSELVLIDLNIVTASSTATASRTSTLDEVSDVCCGAPSLVILGLV